MEVYTFINCSLRARPVMWGQVRHQIWVLELALSCDSELSHLASLHLFALLQKARITLAFLPHNDLKCSFYGSSNETVATKACGKKPLSKTGDENSQIHK